MSKRKAPPIDHSKAATVDAAASTLEKVASFLRRHPAAVVEFIELVNEAFPSMSDSLIAMLPQTAPCEDC